jgi:hypothetical protein
MSDLFRIVEASHESRQCLVKRMVERSVGEGQVIDPGYLEHLTAQFDASARTNSTTAYKETLARIVLSDTFRERDPVSTECYDRAPAEGDDASGKPPCAVAFLLEKHCANCHGAGRPTAGLDLTSWVEVEGGAHSFKHVKGGRQQPAATTLQAVYDRLTTPDRITRMPPGAHIPAGDREQLVLWTDEQLRALNQTNEGGH